MWPAPDGRWAPGAGGRSGRGWLGVDICCARGQLARQPATVPALSSPRGRGPCTTWRGHVVTEEHPAWRMHPWPSQPCPHTMHPVPASPGHPLDHRRDTPAGRGGLIPAACRDWGRPVTDGKCEKENESGGGRSRGGRWQEPGTSAGQHVGTGRAEPCVGEMGARWSWEPARSCWV